MRLEIAEQTTPGATDASRRINFELTNGDVLRADRKDPYGFWFLSLKSGGHLPHPFNGAYTTRDAVALAAKTYISEKPGPVAIGPNERPELKYKPGYGPDGKKLEK